MTDDDVPEGMARVQCIVDLRPWATVDGNALRPLDNNEVVLVPRAEAEAMKKNRHVVEVR